MPGIGQAFAARRQSVAVSLIAGLLAACGGGAVSPSATAPRVTPSPVGNTLLASASPVPSPSASDDTANLDDVAALTIPLEGGPDWPVELDDSLWLLAPDPDLAPEAGEPTVYRLDPATGVEQARIPVEIGTCEAFGAGFGSLWSCGKDEMLRIDPATNSVVARVPFDTALVFGRPAFSADAVWYLGGNVVADSLMRIDPATNAVTDTYPLGHTAMSVVHGHDALWVTSPQDGVLLRVDVASGEVTEALADLPGPSYLAVGPDAVWLLLYGGPDAEDPAGEPALLRYDPESGTADRFGIGGAPGEAGDLLVTDEAVWVRGSDPVLIQVDPLSGSVMWSVTRDPGPGDGSLGLADGALWLTSVDQGWLWRISEDH
jgi:hypothetical protein